MKNIIIALMSSIITFVFCYDIHLNECKEQCISYDSVTHYKKLFYKERALRVKLNETIKTGILISH